LLVVHVRAYVMTSLSTTAALSSSPHRIRLYLLFLWAHLRPLSKSSPVSLRPAGTELRCRRNLSPWLTATDQFFDDITALLERLAVVRVPLFVTGDFNVRSDRDVRHSEQLQSLFDAFGLQRPSGRDLVAVSVDVSLSVFSVDCSDHSLLRRPVSPKNFCCFRKPDRP